MKYTINHIFAGEDEVIVNCFAITPEIETVDGNTFAYTETDVRKLDYTLAQLEQLLSDINFFRCSKSMIINIDKVDSLRSLPSNRIDVRMINGEHIIISRTYASDFRKILKKGAQHG